MQSITDLRLAALARSLSHAAWALALYFYMRHRTTAHIAARLHRNRSEQRSVVRAASAAAQYRVVHPATIKIFMQSRARNSLVQIVIGWHVGS